MRVEVWGRRRWDCSRECGKVGPGAESKGAGLGWSSWVVRMWQSGRMRRMQPGWREDIRQSEGRVAEANKEVCQVHGSDSGSIGPILVTKFVVKVTEIVENGPELLVVRCHVSHHLNHQHPRPPQELHQALLHDIAHPIHPSNPPVDYGE